MGLVLYTIPPQRNWSRNPIRIKAGTDLPLSTVGLYIQCRVLFGVGDAAPTEVISYPLTPDSSGMVDIDLKTLVDKLLTLQLPTLGDAITKVSSQFGTVAIELVEYSIDLPDGGTPLDGGSYTIYKGGVAYERWQGSAWFDSYYTTHKFLSYMGGQRTVQPWQPNWLSYLHMNDTSLDVNMVVGLYYTDGTEDVTTLSFPDGATAESNKIYHLRVGYDQLGLGAIDPTKRVHYYTVKLQSDGTDLTETISFLMDYTPNYEQIAFTFFNSIGGIDTLLILGEQKKTVVRDFDLVDLNTSRSNMGGEILPAQSAMNTVQEQITYKGNIGFTEDARQHDLRRELFMSRNIYQAQQSRWWPVNVTDKSVDKGALFAQVRDCDIEWSYAYSNENYTPLWEDLGTAAEPLLSCPVVSIVATDTSASISFTHAPGPINRYRVQFYTAADVAVGSEQVFTIPFGNPITASITGLTESSSYKFTIWMDDTDSGYTKTCTTGYTFSTAAAPPVPPEGLFQIIVAPAANPAARITNVVSDGASVILDSPATFPVMESSGAVTGVGIEGTVDVQVVYTNMSNNQLVLIDAMGTNHTLPGTVSFSGSLTFTGVVVNSSNYVEISVL